MATKVCYSVGASTADLKTGTPTVTVATGTATFSAAQTGNIGIGDVIDYDTDNKKAIIVSKTSQTAWSVLSMSGGAATAATDVTVNSIKRAFNKLDDAIGKDSVDGQNTGAADASHLNITQTSATPGDLVTADVDLWITCYNDGLDTTLLVEIRYWVTDATHGIHVYVVGDTATECNQSNRYTGTEHSGYYIQNPINAKDDFIVLDGVEVDGNGTVAGHGIWFVDSLAFSGTAKNCIVHDIAGTSQNGFDLGRGCKAQNCVSYANSGHGFEAREGISDPVELTNCLAYSNTGWGIHRATNTPLFLNCMAFANTLGDFSGPSDAATDFNISSDATALGTNKLTSKTDYSSYFTDSAAATFNPTLLGTTGDGGIFGVTGLLGPSNSSDSRVLDQDIFGTTRPSGATAVCIGPDEFVSVADPGLGWFSDPVDNAAFAEPFHAEQNVDEPQLAFSEAPGLEWMVDFDQGASIAVPDFFPESWTSDEPQFFVAPPPAGDTNLGWMDSLLDVYGDDNWGLYPSLTQYGTEAPYVPPVVDQPWFEPTVVHYPAPEPHILYDDASDGWLYSHIVPPNIDQSWFEPTVEPHPAPQPHLTYDDASDGWLYNQIPPAANLEEAWMVDPPEIFAAEAYEHAMLVSGETPSEGEWVAPVTSIILEIDAHFHREKRYFAVFDQ